MRERRLLAVCSDTSAKLDHMFRVSRTGALPLITPIPSSRRSGLLLLLKLRKAPFPYLGRSGMCGAFDLETKASPLLDLHQTLLADVDNYYGLKTACTSTSPKLAYLKSSRMLGNVENTHTHLSFYSSYNSQHILV